MKVDPIKLAKRVERWQYRLTELGVGHWRIECVTITSPDGMPNGPDADASVQVSSQYDSYHVWFNEDFLARTNKRRLDETIVHELMHVVMRDLDFAMDQVEDWLPPASYNDWTNLVQHEREAMVEKLARLVVRLYKNDTARFAPE